MHARRRDAARTRRLLLDEAKRRFARDGYAATTVRDIADGAGVNVALISRYFTSKEGLFEACLADAVTELDRSADIRSPGEVAADMAHRIAGTTAEQQLNEGLLLLLRSSGDERVDELRRRILRSVSTRLAAIAGSTDDATLLRAQVVLATALGVALLRASPSVAPLASATAEELEGPLAEVITALLTPR